MSLLQNKKVVVTLAVTALALVVAQVMPQLGGGSVDVAAREDEVPADPQAPQAALSTVSTNRFRSSVELVNWRQLFSESEAPRNPFLSAGPSSEDPGENDPAAAPGSATVLKLQAISLSNSKPLAVVNRQVLAVGESVGGFEVVKIGLGEVVLQGFGETRILHFDYSAPTAPASEPPEPKPQPDKP